jgi:hypothetical protein
MAFRRSKKIGPLQFTISKSGLTGSVGAGGVRYQFLGGSKRRGRKPAQAEPDDGVHSNVATVIGGFGIVAGWFIAAAFLLSLGGNTPEVVANVEPEKPAIEQSTTPPIEAQPEPVPEPAANGLRTWTDSTGKFKLDAELVRVSDGMVYLLSGGKTKPVPINRLSKTDQSYIARAFPRPVAKKSSAVRPPATATPSPRAYTPPAPIDRNPYGEATTGYTATGIPIHTGPRGGRYHYSKSGKKVYERRKR